MHTCTIIFAKYDVIVYVIKFFSLDWRIVIIEVFVEVMSHLVKFQATFLLELRMNFSLMISSICIQYVIFTSNLILNLRLRF